MRIQGQSLDEMAGKEQIVAYQVQTFDLVIAAFAAVERKLSGNLLIREDRENIVAVRIVGYGGVLSCDEFQFPADAEFYPQNGKRKKFRIDDSFKEICLAAADCRICLLYTSRCV